MNRKVHILLQNAVGQVPNPADASLFWEIDVRFRYDTEDPWALTLELEGKCWSFGLDLLSDARLSPNQWTGEGDVLVYAPERQGDYGIILRSPSGAIQLWFKGRDIESFQELISQFQPAAIEAARALAPDELSEWLSKTPTA